MTPPEKTVEGASNLIEDTPNSEGQTDNPRTPQVMPSLTFHASPNLTSQAMQEAGVYLQRFLKIMGGQITPTAPQVPIAEEVVPTQGLVTTSNDPPMVRQPKLKSKIVRGEPSKACQLSDSESTYSVSSKRRSKPTNSGNSDPRSRHYKEKQRSQRSRWSKTPPLGGKTSNPRPDRLTARRRLDFGTRPSSEAPNLMAGEIQRLREDMDKLQVDAVVYLVDAFDKERFAESKKELDALLSDEALADVPFLVLGNKIDIPYAASEDELRYHLGLTNFTTGKGKVNLTDSNVRPLEVFMCSIVRKMGYGDGFKWVSQYIK
ncbi:hypothetical protein LWI29_021957 [Acer saccharum]|uniref:Uncharacterized protein n=1 Tax=Acer saccharum TaxID=4024 RepID=A0AA39RXB3_ACESA|nr:hypothetical protein LWI29_021957 [Acer saccharum]